MKEIESDFWGSLFCLCFTIITLGVTLGIGFSKSSPVFVATIIVMIVPFIILFTYNMTLDIFLMECEEKKENEVR